MQGGGAGTFTLFLAAMGAGPRALQEQLLGVLARNATAVMTNVPGPADALYLAGARMLTSWPVSIVTHGLGLNITVQSYCGSLDFGIIAARTAVPDLDPLVRALHEAHAELQRCGRRSGAASGPEGKLLE